jgi:methionyl-tRNA formyltransferase
MKKYKLIFIGNREAILRSLILRKDIALVAIYATNSELINSVIFNSFNIQNGLNKNDVINAIKVSKFDILLSAGCPYRLPIEELPESKIYLNIHPSYLPLGRGPSPLNESFLFNRKFFGITLHYMNVNFDDGNVIYQKKIKLTEDLDLSLLFLFVFDLEKEVFIKGFNKLIKMNFKLVGKPQIGKKTFFSRKNFATEVDLVELRTDKFINYVKAFSFNSQSLIFKTRNQKIKCFHATKITNAYLKKRFQCLQVGEIFEVDSRNIIIKLKDGLVRVSNFSYAQF